MTGPRSKRIGGFTIEVTIDVWDWRLTAKLNGTDVADKWEKVIDVALRLQQDILMEGILHIHLCDSLSQ